MKGAYTAIEARSSPAGSFCRLRSLLNELARMPPSRRRNWKSPRSASCDQMRRRHRAGVVDSSMSRPAPRVNETRVRQHEHATNKDPTRQSPDRAGKNGARRCSGQTNKPHPRSLKLDQRRALSSRDPADLVTGRSGLSGAIDHGIVRQRQSIMPCKTSNGK
jgi:hypothetical protein